MGYKEILQKNWRAWREQHGGVPSNPALATVARWTDYYGKNVIPKHGLQNGDTVTHVPSGRTGIVRAVQNSGFITVQHGEHPDHSMEDYHHTELHKSALKGEKMNNWGEWDKAHAGMKAKAKEIFVGFKGRDGVKPEQAGAEFDRIHAAGDKSTYMDSVKSTPKIKPDGSRASRQEKVTEGHSNVNAFENAYNHAGFAVAKKSYATILKGKGAKGQTWKLIGGKRVYSGGAGAAAPTHWQDTPEQHAKDGAHRDKYSALDKHHYEARQFHRQQAQNTDGRFTFDEIKGHLDAAKAHGMASDNAQYALHTMNKDGNALYTGRQEGLSAAASAATDKTSPVGASSSPPPLEGSTRPAGLPANPQPSPLGTAQVKPEDAHTSTSASHAPAAAQGINHPSNHMDVAKTIMQQYGGNKFRAMTGANNLMASAEGGGALTMKLPKTAGATKGVKYVKTVYQPSSDTYDVHMLGRTGDVKHSAHGIYADQLQSHFKHHTGLDTHL